MRVCIDGRLPRTAGGTGVTTYGRVLAETVEMVGHRVEWLTEGRTGSRARVWMGALRPSAWPAPLRDDRRTAGELFRSAQVRFDLRRSLLPVRAPDPPALMHWTYPLPLRLLDVPNLYTIHDLIPVLHPGLSPVPPRRMERLLRRVAQAAAHVVTVSEASRREIMDVLHLPPDRVSNLYQAVAEVPPPDAALGRALEGLGLERGQYVLHVGSVERRKNIHRLIRAHRDSRIPLRLVIAGPDGWNAVGELAEMGPEVVRIPWLPRPQLVALVAGARLLVAPSLAEGFGLPVAEAMAWGTAVVCSRGGALEEVAGGAARLVDPTDTAALAATLAELSADDDATEALVSAGRTRANLFTRAAYAVRLRALHARVGQS